MAANFSAGVAASLACLTSKTIVSMVDHRGNIAEVGHDLAKASTVKEVVGAGLTAGITKGVTSTLKIPTTDLSGFSQHFNYNATRAAVGAGVGMAMGEKPGDALRTAAACTVANTLAGMAANELSDLRSDMLNEGDNLLKNGLHKVGHFAGAAASYGIGAAIQGEDIGRAALAAGTGAAAGEIFGETVGLNAMRKGAVTTETLEQNKGSLVAMSKVVGATTAMLSGLDAGTASRAAENAVENNLLPALAAVGAACGGTASVGGGVAAISAGTQTAIAAGVGILTAVGLNALVNKDGEGETQSTNTTQGAASSGGGMPGDEDPEDDKNYSERTQKLLGRTNDYKEQLFERAGKTKQDTTLNAARSEIKGEQIDLAKHRGVEYDHITKVQNAQRGLKGHIDNINKRLEFVELPLAERQALNRELSNASKLLDYTEQFVPRN
ncbi:polymorphic toxin type 28 domain-containing protein [Candidatus Odyssella thessalonicensis]|uniref:polymorphic toxin type 28 domain-containing protein n=1 Tax=Candidatus Odyssella thessalonicensis TaxID=84647 RepID=UPI000225BFBE|nr:polymorphic toxin type 28 domain-containing protein [Candidatus Odyssella thessalonicensis]